MDDGNYMKDSEGRLVPVENVRPIDKLEDQLVNQLLSLARHHNNRLCDFKAEVFSDIKAFMDILSEKYNVKRGGRKGNLTLMSYDGLRKVQYQNADYIQFGPSLQVAKTLIDECITEWSDGANSNLKLIVDKAFQVNKEGKLNTGEILGLRRLNIPDEKWKRAMEAINDSIKVVLTRAYVRFYERKDIEAPWQSISLDMASV